MSRSCGLTTFAVLCQFIQCFCKMQTGTDKRDGEYVPFADDVKSDGGTVEMHEWSGMVLKLKGLFFLDALGSSTWGRFGTIYYNLPRKGLNAQQIGQIEGIMPIITAFSSPMWGAVADKIHWKKLVFLVTKVFSSITLCSLAIHSWTDKSQFNFYIILGVSSVVAFFTSGSVLDAYAIDHTGAQGEKLYGRIRMFSSLSWGLGSTAMGFLTDWTGSFDICFYIYGSFQILTWLMVIFALPTRTKAEQVLEDRKASPELRSLAAFFCAPSTLLFLLEVFVMGMAVGVVERLLFVFLQNDLNASTSLCGLTVMVTVSLEVPCFYFAGAINRRLGVSGSLVVSYLCYIFRVFGYTLLTKETVWWVLPLELTHGPCFALLWSTVIEYSRLYSPPEWLSTTQSLVSLIYFSLGCGSGAFVGGWIMFRWGSKTMYTIFGCVVSLLLARRLLMVLCGGNPKIQSPRGLGDKTTQALLTAPTME